MKLTTVTCFFLIMGTFMGIREISASGQEDGRTSVAEEVMIAGNAIRVPLGRILLVRKNSHYCAVKFTESGGKISSTHFANYESYYQGDGSGDFSKKNVELMKEKLVDRPAQLGRLWPIPFGHTNIYVKCGPIKLSWSGGTSVYFYGRQKQGDYGIELAPTKWIDISQVNVFDPRLNWYRYDGERKRVCIPIDQLWEN